VYFVTERFKRFLCKRSLQIYRSLPTDELMVRINRQRWICVDGDNTGYY